MRKQITINIPMLLLIFGILYMLYITFKKPVIVEYNQQPIIDSIIKQNKSKIKADSIKLSIKIDSFNKCIKTLNFIRKNERNKFEQEISKFNRPFDSTDFTRTNDSIKKVCCPNNTN